MDNDNLDKLFSGMNLPSDDDIEKEERGGPEVTQISGTMGDIQRAIAQGKLPKELGMLLSAIASESGAPETKRVEVERKKAKVAWVKRFNELHELAGQGKAIMDDLSEILSKMQRKHRLVWSMIAEDMEDDRAMKFDEKTGEVVIYEDED